MRKQEDDGEDFSYRSSTEVPEAERVSSKDEEDFSTLKQLVGIVDDTKAKCSSISIINTHHPKLSAEQQVEAYQFVLEELILPFELAVKDAITEVKMKLRGIK